MFYLIGLGLFDVTDMSLKAINVLKEVDIVYAEFFTSRLMGSNLKAIEDIIGKKINVLVRNEVEEDSPFIEEAKNKKVALITGGDPLIATTHSDFLVQCSKKGIDYQVIHGSSIISSAPAISGLQAYKFGKVTTIPFPDHNFFPKSPYMAIKENLDMDRVASNRSLQVEGGYYYRVRCTHAANSDMSSSFTNGVFIEEP